MFGWSAIIMVIIVGFGSNATNLSAYLKACLAKAMMLRCFTRRFEKKIAQTSIHRLLQYDHRAADQWARGVLEGHDSDQQSPHCRWPWPQPILRKCFLQVFAIWKEILLGCVCGCNFFLWRRLTSSSQAYSYIVSCAGGIMLIYL